MTITDIDPDDISTNPTHGHGFDDIVRRRASRRSVLAAGGMTAAATFLTTGMPGAAATASHGGHGTRHLLGFDPIPLGIADEIVVPEGTPHARSSRGARHSPGAFRRSCPAPRPSSPAATPEPSRSNSSACTTTACTTSPAGRDGAATAVACSR